MNENKQLALKTYKNEFTQEEFNKILQITGGDNYTKAVADAYQIIKNNEWAFNRFKLEDFYKQLKNYNKNVVPINFNVNNITTNDLILFKKRQQIIKILNELPKIAIRNLKKDIRLENNTITKLLDSLEYLWANLSQLDNRPEEVKEKFYKKIFTSKHTLEDMVNIVDDKAELIGGVDLNKDKINEIVQDNNELDIIYQKDHAWVIMVDGPY